MSESKLYNVPANTLRPGPTLVITRSAEGLTTGSMDFYCRKGDLSSSAVLAKLAKGTPILTLYSQIGAKFTYLNVDSWTSRDNPGAFSTVSVDFKGVDPNELTSNASVVYNRNNSIVEDSIFNSPKLISAVPNAAKRALFRLGTKGVVALVGSATLEYTANNEDCGSLDNAAETFWWNYIVEKENLTYERASSEWTKSATGVGALTDADFLNLSWIDTPDGSPGSPSDYNWRYMGSTETITATGDGTNSYSQTWLMGVWPTEVFTKPT
jgi:hypothetical protein